MAAAAPEMRRRIAGGMTASIFAIHFISPFVSQPMIAAFGFANTYVYTVLVVGGIAILGSALATRRARSNQANKRTFNSVLSATRLFCQSERF